MIGRLPHIPATCDDCYALANVYERRIADSVRRLMADAPLGEWTPELKPPLCGQVRVFKQVSDLVEYGIQTEESRFRIHVAFATGNLFLFPTDNARETIASQTYPVGHAYQGKRITGVGYKVPPCDIAEMDIIRIPEDVLRMYSPRESDDESIKGHRASILVMEMMSRGLLRLPFDPTEQNAIIPQLKGHDVIAIANYTVQVKCDYNAGDKGTGNLFLQTHERNPHGKH